MCARCVLFSAFRNIAFNVIFKILFSFVIMAVFLSTLCAFDKNRNQTTKTNVCKTISNYMCKTFAMARCSFASGKFDKTVVFTYRTYSYIVTYDVISDILTLLLQINNTSVQRGSRRFLFYMLINFRPCCETTKMVYL